MLVEFSVEESSFENGLVVKGPRTHMEQSARPTAMAWYPDTHVETFIITANSELKLKLHNAATKMCRHTALGPLFGSPVQKLAALPAKGTSKTHILVYSTQEKVRFLSVCW
jgi:hypothetical protein